MLAAGRSSRFGGDKLLAPWRGQPLLVRTLAAVRAAVEAGSLAGGCVVVPTGREELAELVRAVGFEPVANAAAATGLASSLRAGIGWLEQVVPEGGPAAAVIFLGDQPLVRPEVVARLVATWVRDRAAAVRPRYAGASAEPGHPLLLDRAYWPLATALTGDAGVGPALSAHGVAIAIVDVPGRNPDVDTPADLTDL